MNSSPKQVKECLHIALGNIPDFDQCTLLDYPDHYNIGDHLIWLGNIFYLTKVRSSKINYVSSKENFSDEMFSKHSAEGPILLHGGGNFGDLWPEHQNFREHIVEKYKQRSIVILPQTVFFSNEKVLEESAKVFNHHPDLTIFARDEISFQTLTKAFVNCKIYKSPDTAFQLVDIPKAELREPSKETILYLRRTDREMGNLNKIDELDMKELELEVEDWNSYKWLKSAPDKWLPIPGRVRLFREGWQKGLKDPIQFLSRQSWQWLHPFASTFQEIHLPHLHRKSWGLMHTGIYQIQAHEFVVTNRLHVHILCLILGIPHLIIPGSYYKIEAFYQDWTSNISLGTLVKENSDIEAAIKKLKNKSC